MEEFLDLQLFAGEGVSGGGGAAGGKANGKADSAGTPGSAFPTENSEPDRNRAAKVGNENKAAPSELAGGPAARASSARPLGKNRKSFRREREGYTDSPEMGEKTEGDTARASNARPYGDGFDYTEQAVLEEEPDRNRAARVRDDNTDGSCALAGGPAARAAKARNDDTDVSCVLKEHFRRLEGEAEQMREVFPGFDLRRELRDPRFAALTAPGMGVSVEDAYYALHRRELQAASMQVAARSAARKIASSIQSAARRPVENSGESAAPAGIGPQNLSREQREQLRQRIHNAAALGEKIYP